MASLTGLPLSDLVDMTDSQLESVDEVARDNARRLFWSSETEMLASILDQLRALTAMLNAGIRVQPVKRLPSIRDVADVERPDWMTKRDAAQVMTPRELFAARAHLR